MTTDWTASKYYSAVKITNARAVSHMYEYTWDRYGEGTLYWDQSGPDYIAALVRKQKEKKAFLERQGWPEAI